MKWLQRITALFAGTFVISEMVNDQEEIIELGSSDTFQTLVEGLKNILLSPILLIFKLFIQNPKEFFIGIGESVFNALGLTPENIISANFVFIVIGLIIGIMILKYIITWAFEYLSKLLDPM